MSEEKFWCEHLAPGKMWMVDKPGFVDFSRWNYCPLCGVQRPPEAKKLAQILFEAFQSTVKKPLAWENVTSDLIKRGSQAQAKAVARLVEDLCHDDSVADIVEKLEEML